MKFMDRKLMLLLIFFSWFKAEGQIDVNDFTLDSTVEFRAGNYHAGDLKSFLFGRQNRKVWSKPVKARVFDLKKSGLTVIKQGGSRQTTNLRLVDPAGRQYVLRSIDKTPSRNLPEGFQDTFISDIVQDQTSTGHPYGAFTLAPMADAINTLHTTPVLVYVPYDPAFGEYAELLANKPALMEERPDSAQTNIPNFGYAPNVIGTEKLYEKLAENHKNKIDERLYIRTRLFDMLIGDWGRHEDQWRWAEFESENGILFKPIPRDRDHAYFRFNGLLPKMASNLWGLRHLEDFDFRVRNYVDINRSARNIDRRLLYRSELKDWIEEAEYLKSNLTDEIIESSVKLMPAEAYDISGKQIAEKLKSRRNQLPEIAKGYYEVLAKEVYISGSDKPEIFEISRAEGDKTNVKIFARDASGGAGDEIYNRTFTGGPTRFLDIYGLGADDKFIIKGGDKTRIKLRMIGGDGNDSFLNRSMKDTRRTVSIYDSKDFELDNSCRNLNDNRSNNPKDSVNEYIKPFNYNYWTPYAFLGFNADDFIFLGLGIMKKDFGFRKSPYKALYKFGANYATQTGAFNFRVFYDRKKLYHCWGVNFDGRVLGPQYVYNYFGFGNESVYNDSIKIDFYRVRGNQVYLNPNIYNQITSKLSIGAGPEFDYFRIEKPEEGEQKFIFTPGAVDDPTVFDENYFGGVRVFMRMTNADTILLPANGYLINLEARGLDQFKGNGNKRFIQALGSAAIYKTFKFLSPLTYAARIGGGANFGDYYFYQAPNLGGTENLRGYRRTRFYGDYSMFLNQEIRAKLFRYNNNLFQSDMGIYGFFDTGRVWTDVHSDKWHYGYGPGFWISFYKKFMFSTYLGISEDGYYVNFHQGFFF